MNVLVVSQDPVELARMTDGIELAFTAAIRVADSASSVPGIVLAAADLFDLVVVDGDLRPRGGYAALYELRAAEDLAGRSPTPAIIVGTRQEDHWLAQWARADAVVAKPVDPFALARCARRTARRASATS